MPNLPGVRSRKLALYALKINVLMEQKYEGKSKLQQQSGKVMPDCNSNKTNMLRGGLESYPFMRPALRRVDDFARKEHENQ